MSPLRTPSHGATGYRVPPHNIAHAVPRAIACDHAQLRARLCNTICTFAQMPTHKRVTPYAPTSEQPQYPHITHLPTLIYTCIHTPTPTYTLTVLHARAESSTFNCATLSHPLKEPSRKKCQKIRKSFFIPKQHKNKAFLRFSNHYFFGIFEDLTFGFRRASVVFDVRSQREEVYKLRVGIILRK